MIRRIRRSLPWFGAVAALLVFPLPVQADDIEPEPYVEEEVAEPEPEPAVEAKEEARTEAAPAAASYGPSVGAKIFDCAVLRQFGFAMTLIGGAFFVPVAALAAPSGAESIQTAWEQFVVAPAEYTFTRPIGEF